MFNYLKMAKLDYYTLKSQLLSYTSILLIILMFGFMSSSIFILGLVVALFTALSASNVFITQEKNNLERLYASRSIAVKNIISGRYISIFTIYIIALSFSIVVDMGFATFQNRFVSFGEIITAICVSLFMFTIIVGMQVPIYFRYGYTKAKTICVIPILVISGAIMVPSFTTIFSNVITEIINHQVILNIVCITLSLVILFFSYNVSVIGYRKRK